MEALDILEKRIDSLSRILGPVPEINAAEAASATTPDADTAELGVDETVPSSPSDLSIVDSLLSTHALLCSATNGREEINKAIKRAPELEKFLDTNFQEESEAARVRSKEVYLNAISSDLQEEFAQLEQIKQLEPTLGAEYFRNIPGERTEKLKQFAQDNVDYAQQAELIEESLILAMKRYGELQSGLMETLNVMNARMEAIEERLERKKHDELNKEVDGSEGK